MKIRPLYNNGLHYFVIGVLLFTLTIENPDNKLIDTPHFVFDHITPTTIICVIGVALILLKSISEGINIDYITILLIVRIILALIPMFYISDVPDFLGNLETTILCFISYYIAKNFVDDPNKIKFSMLFLFLLIVVQVVFESYMGPISFFDDTYVYKNNLILPIGGSNAIAAIIIPCFSFLLCIIQGKVGKGVIFILAFLSVILTKSRSGIIALLIMFFLILIFTNKINLKRTIKFITIIALLSILYVLFFEKGDLLMDAFSKTNNTIIERFQRWSMSLDLFIKHPIFGVSYLIQDAKINPHNWILNILASGGIFGVLLSFLLIFNIISTLKGKKDDRIIIGSICFVLAILLQGLGEITLFTSRTDFFFWFVIGVAMKEAKLYKEKKRYRKFDYE